MRKLFKFIALSLALLPFIAQAQQVSGPVPTAAYLSAMTGNGSGGTLINLLGVVSIADDYPLFASESQKLQNRDFEDEMLHAQRLALNLGAAAKSQNGPPPCVAVIGMPLTTGGQIFTAPRFLPRYVCPPTGMFYIRDGDNGAAIGNWNGDPFVENLINLQEPLWIYPPTSQVPGETHIQANFTNTATDGGSGYMAGRTYGMATLIPENGGTGFSGGEQCATKIGDTRYPATGALFSCATASGGACTAITFAPTHWQFSASTAPSRGEYLLPPFLQREQYAVSGRCNSNGDNECWDGHDAFHPQVFDSGLNVTGNTHTSTTIDGLSSTTGLTVSAAISGTGIPAGTTISAVNASAGSITISNAATSTLSGVTLQVGNFFYNTTCYVNGTCSGTCNGFGVCVGGSGTCTAQGAGLTVAAKYWPDWCGAPSYTGNTHTNTTIDNLSSMTGFAVGQYITGSGIPANTTITVVGVSSLTISNATSSSLTGTTLSINPDNDTIACVADTSGPNATPAYDGIFSNVQPASTHIGDIYVEQSGEKYSALFGYTFGSLVDSFETTIDYSQEQGSYYGQVVYGTDFLEYHHNPVDNAIQTKLRGGGGLHILFDRNDTPIDSINSDAHAVEVDNCEDCTLDGTWFHNAGSAATVGTISADYIRLGSDTQVAGTSNENSGGWIHGDVGSDGTLGNNLNAIGCKYSNGMDIALNVANNTKANAARAQQFTKFADFGTHCEIGMKFSGMITNQSDPLYTGTFPAGVSFHPINGKTGGTDMSCDVLASGGGGWTDTGIGTGEENLVSIQLPPMGPNDSLEIVTLWTKGGTLTDTTNAVIRLGTATCTPGSSCTAGNTVMNISETTSALTTVRAPIWVHNQNATNAQVTFPSASQTNFTSSGSVTSVATQTNSIPTLNIDGITATSSADSIKLESYTVKRCNGGS